MIVVSVKTLTVCTMKHFFSLKQLAFIKEAVNFVFCLQEGCIQVVLWMRQALSPVQYVHKKCNYNQDGILRVSHLCGRVATIVADSRV